MKKIINPCRILPTFLFVILLALIPLTEIWAATHIILFGGAVGLNYSPNSLSVNVGDTIEWRGDFSFHPLSSTTIPSGATSWHVGSGTVFEYHVTIAGTYNYQCDAHFASGMIGSFTAITTSSVILTTTEPPSAFSLSQNFPNPFNPGTTIRFDINYASFVSLKVYNVLGQEIATLVNDKKEIGRYEIRFDGTRIPGGIYFYRLIAGSFIETKKMQLMK